MAEAATKPLERPFRLAVIGCGAVAGKHIQALRAAPRVQLVALVDPDRQRARQRGEEFRIDAQILGDAESALASLELDGVVICSPTGAHYRQTMLALERGLDVLCEKPLASRRDEIITLSQTARDTGRILCVAFQRRYEATYASARRELLERREPYGPVRSMSLFVCERWQPTILGTWRDDPQLGFGYFGDAGVHQVDASAFITGMRPRRLLARGERRGCQVQIVTQVLSEWGGPAGDAVPMTAHFVGDAHHWREELTFHAQRADLLIRDCKPFVARDNQVAPLDDLVPEITPAGAFLAAMWTRQPTRSPALESLVGADWNEGVLRSLECNDWVELPAWPTE